MTLSAGPGPAATRAAMTDLHNHVIPGVDDGAADREATRAALQALLDDGVRRVVATPHVMGSLTLDPAGLAERLAAIDRAWAVAETIGAEFPGLELGRGSEIMLDVPEPDLSDARLRLAGGRTVLVEFPFMVIPPYAARPLARIREHGFSPLLAHPERYLGVSVAAVEEWRKAGAYIQVNGPALLGKYGDGPRRIALELLELGLVDCLSSDYHARGRPLVADYRRVLEERGAAEQAELLTATNPARAVAGEVPIPVGPMRTRRGAWTRMLSALRHRPGRSEG